MERTQILNKRLNLLCALVSISGNMNELREKNWSWAHLPHISDTHSSRLTLQLLDLLQVAYFLSFSCFFCFFITSNQQYLFNTNNCAAGIFLCFSRTCDVRLPMCMCAFRHFCLFFAVFVWSLTSFIWLLAITCVLRVRQRQPRGNMMWVYSSISVSFPLFARYFVHSTTRVRYFTYFHLNKYELFVKSDAINDLSTIVYIVVLHKKRFLNYLNFLHEFNLCNWTASRKKSLIKEIRNVKEIRNLKEIWKM